MKLYRVIFNVWGNDPDDAINRFDEIMNETPLAACDFTIKEIEVAETKLLPINEGDQK